MSISLPKYTRRETPLLPRWQRVWTIIAAGLRREFRRPAALFPVIAGVFLSTITAIFLLFFASLFNPGRETDLSFFFVPASTPTTLFFVTLLASTVGAGLIADDVHSNALTLYLSRPITQLDYLIAKGAILAGAIQHPGLLYLSPWEVFLAVARAGYGAPAGPIDWPGALAILVGVTILAAFLAYLRMRSMEVVAA